VSPRAGLDDVENRKFLTLPGLELRPLGRPVKLFCYKSTSHENMTGVCYTSLVLCILVMVNLS
jgi:hypothetical protein